MIKRPEGAFRWIQGGVTAPRGFRAQGMHCGLKRFKTKDLALIVSETPAVATGAFTANKLKASCVLFNQRQLEKGRAQAIIANSGNANCLNGEAGNRDTRAMARFTARELGLKPRDVLVASTGLIGVPLPLKKIRAAVPHLAAALGPEGHRAAAEAILTTDRRVKEAAVALGDRSGEIRIGAMAKGAGMIHPSMGVNHTATMLCFITTDATVERGALGASLSQAVDQTFNRITVDADQSTNDMVLLLANGASGGPVIRKGSAGYHRFTRALEAVCLYLAKFIVWDAEGATKFVEIQVRRARTMADARAVADAVASSKLVKTALFGSDPNWGRIAASVGYARAKVEPKKLTIKLASEPVVRRGERVRGLSRSELHRIFKRKCITIQIDLNLGGAGLSIWTCDLSTRYVRINSAYSS